MATLKPSSTWFDNPHGITRPSITRINIKNTFTPAGSEKSWSGGDGVTCYVDTQNVLTIVGDGSGYIKTTSDASWLFSESTRKAPFSNVVEINGANLIDTSAATTLERVFQGMQSCEFVDVSNWKTGNVTNFNGTFSQMYTIWSLNVSEWDTHLATDMAFMFQLCMKVRKLDLSKWDMSHVITTRGMFQGHSSVGPMDLTTLGDTSRWNLNSLEDAEAMFVRCQLMERYECTYWDLRKLRSARNMFRDNVELLHLDCENWQLDSLEDACNMFSSCRKMDFPIFNKTDFSHCKNFAHMFWGACIEKPMDFSNWNMDNAETLDHFTAHSKSVITGTAHWKCPRCINYNATFHTCYSEELDLRNLQVNQAQFLSQMFEGSKNLKRIIGIEKWIGSECVSYDQMFSTCPSIEELNIPLLDTRKAKDGIVHGINGNKSKSMAGIFDGMYSLKKLTVGPNFSWNGDGTTETSAHHAILPTPTEPDIAGADGKWYSINGDSFAPNNMPQLTAGTYYASKALIEDEEVLLKNKFILQIAKSIRSKGVMVDKTAPSGFSSAIDAINTGGSSENDKHKFMQDFLNHNITTFDGTGIVTIGKVEFYGGGNTVPFTEVTNFYFPDLVESKNTSMVFNKHKATEFFFPKLEKIGSNFFNRCPNVTQLDLPALKSVPEYTFYDLQLLDTVILRNNELVPLINVNAFYNTPMTKGTGFIYVPKILVDQYKTATNWTSFADQIRAIEDYQK